MQVRRLIPILLTVVLVSTVGLAFTTRQKRPPSTVLEHSVSLKGRDTLIRECVQYRERVCTKYLYGQRPYDSNLEYWLLVIPINRGNQEDVRQVRVQYKDWLVYNDGQLYP